MAIKQSQEGNDADVVIQSARDTIINNGISSENMREIISILADQLPAFAQMAATVAENRCKEFEEKIIKRFEADAGANRESFKDPDFQYLLQDAQRSYVRSGDDQISEQLADLIVERSKLDGRSRKGMAIRKAIETTPQLTAEEISVLSTVFAIKYVKFGIDNDRSALGMVLKHIYDAFVVNISEPDGSINYLESIGCGSVSVMTSDIVNIFITNYPDITKKLKNKRDIVQFNTEIYNFALASGLLTLDDQGDLKSSIENENELSRAFFEAGGKFSEEEVSGLIQSVRPENMNSFDICQSLRRFCPEIDEIFRIWISSNLKSFDLNSTGIAIAHTNFKRIMSFNAPLDIWVK
jgi:hypothetical protein